MTVALNARGVFSWSEWTEALGRELRLQPADDGGEGYFRCWLRALETLIGRKGVAHDDEVTRIALAWQAAAAATPHGKPIELPQNAVEGLRTERDAR